MKKLWILELTVWADEKWDYIRVWHADRVKRNLENYLRKLKAWKVDFKEPVFYQVEEIKK